MRTSLDTTTSARRAAHKKVHASVVPRHPWFSLFCVCLGVMMTFVNVTSTISSLSAIQADLHTSTTTLVWVTSAYSLAVAGLTLSAGTLGDLVGRRTIFLVGTAVLGIGSLACFAAQDAGLVIAGEAIMGAGGAMVLPNSLTVVSTSFADTHRRTEAISIWAGFSGVGLAAGPLIAGVLLGHFSWHSVFLVNAALAVLVLAIAPLFVVNSRHAGRRLDVPGLVLATVAVVALTYAVIEGGHAGYTSSHILIAAGVFLLALAGFILVELRSADPMLELRLFRSVSFSATMAVGMAAMFGFGGLPLVMVLYIQRVQNASSLQTGWRLVPMFVVYVAVSAIAGRLAARVGFKILLVTGLVVTAIGALLLLAVPAATSSGWIWPGIVVFGLGEGLVLAPTTAAAIGSVIPQRAGMASAAINMFRQFGNVLGASVIGTLLTSHFADLLPGRLATAHLSHPLAAQVAVAATDGTPAPATAGTQAGVIGGVLARAFTDSVHLAMAVIAIVLAVVAMLAVVFIPGRARHES
jgi:EmrB/QacA subfamily drug resistance transporter